jgi:multidrug resistance efflux pump
MEKDGNGSGSNQRSFTQFVKHRHLTLLLPIMMIAVLLAAGYGAFYFFSHHGDESNIVRASGRIEAPETHISAPTATRVKSVAVKEGDSVHKGQLIVTLDSEKLQKKINESAPALNAALHARRETDVQVAAVQKQISEARAKSHGFFAKIFSTKSGREKQEIQLRSEMLQAKMMSMQARSAVSSVQGARTQASAKLSFFNITSPIDGICTVRSTQPGELVAAGQVMLTLVSPNSAYVRSFVPESDVARVKIGQAAQVFLDSTSTKPLSGRVTAIDEAPSFTPENVYFKKDRVRQAFGIKISIDHPNGLAKPGMPAEAKIVVNSEKKSHQ